MQFDSYQLDQQRDKYNRQGMYMLAKVLRILTNFALAGLKVVGMVVISILQMVGIPIGKRETY